MADKCAQTSTFYCNTTGNASELALTQESRKQILKNAEVEGATPVMRTLLVAVVLVAFCSTNSNAAPAEWRQSLEVDDRDDSKTFTSSIMPVDQASMDMHGALVVRHHEKSQSKQSKQSKHSEPSDYMVGWLVPGALMTGAFTTCGDTGSRAEHSGWRNIQIRVDDGEVMSFTGSVLGYQNIAVLRNGIEDNVAMLIKSLIGAKKVVIRTKDKCYKKGEDWLLSKFEGITGQHHLKHIKHQP